MDAGLARAAQVGMAMIFLFEVHIAPGYSAEQYAEAWIRASTIMQRAPGARGTRLHRKLDDPRVLLAIASWETKSHRDAMERNQVASVQQIIAQQAEFVEVRVIGEFDDAQWVVDPPS